MRQCLLLFTLLLICCAALADTVPDGNVHSAYRLSYDSTALDGWDIFECIEAEGLLLTACTDCAEITLSIDASTKNAEDFVDSYLEGVTRYGRIIGKAAVSEYGKSGCIAEYSYQSLRGTDTDDTFVTIFTACPLTGGYMITVSSRSWGLHAEEYADMFKSQFLPSVELFNIYVSDTYTAYLTDVSETADGLKLTFDFCSIAYDTNLGFAFAENDICVEQSYLVSKDALIYLPQTGSALYSITRCDVEAAADGITALLNSNEYKSIFYVQLDKSGQVIRLQHYNAL